MAGPGGGSRGRPGRLARRLLLAAGLAAGLAALPQASPSAESAAATASPGDAARGRGLFESRCVACHALDRDRVGPALGGVVGRTAGSRPGYDYSPALAAAGFDWTPALLERWLASPQALVPGQKMPISVGSRQDRADLVAYLATTARPASP